MEKETPRRGKTYALFGYLQDRKTQKEKTEVKKLKAFKQWRENMETMSLIDQKIDDWLKE